MRTKASLWILTLAISMLAPAASIAPAAEKGKSPATGAGKPKVVRDLLWVWGIPKITDNSQRTMATFAQASPAERVRLLGTPNIMMAGAGVPHDMKKAGLMSRQVSDAPRLVWEIMEDGEGAQPFTYEKRLSNVRKLVDKYPQIEAVLLDDMSTVKISKGFKPRHIRKIRQSLRGKYAAIKIWGVWYTMTFNQKGIQDYIQEIDVINLWTWHAKDLVDLEKNVAHCEKLYPDKPIMLGLYMYDYGSGRRMPLDLHQQQCETALKLAHAGRIKGIVFLTITDDAEVVSWTADWVKRVGSQKLGSPSARIETPAKPKKPPARPNSRLTVTIARR